MYAFLKEFQGFDFIYMSFSGEISALIQLIKNILIQFHNNF